MLNSEQKRASKDIQRWWKSSTSYLVLDSKGGTGKSFLVNYILKEIDATPLILAPTNEALSQLRDKLDNWEDYKLKTVHSALGITPTTDTKDLKFRQGTIPSIWETVDLAIIDEVSMISEDILRTLVSIGIKILWIGHSSQLPPIQIKRKRTDKCLSPVFTQGWDTITLSTPMRNTGALWEYNLKVEEMIYDVSKTLPNTYDIKKKDLTNYLTSDKGKSDLLSGVTKVVMWSNAGVDSYNEYIRELIHGTTVAKKHKFLDKDHIILTKPYTSIDALENYSDSMIFKLPKQEGYYTNTKFIVKSCSKKIITLNSSLAIPCYRLVGFLKEAPNVEHVIYTPIDTSIIKVIAEYYAHIAWNSSSSATKAKSIRERHALLSVFAEVKHYFAATSHRLQGCSISKVIVKYNDVLKNSNRVERAKCLYVSTSRVEDTLMIYRGF